MSKSPSSGGGRDEARIRAEKKVAALRGGWRLPRVAARPGLQMSASHALKPTTARCEVTHRLAAAIAIRAVRAEKERRACSHRHESVRGSVRAGIQKSHGSGVVTMQVFWYDPLATSRFWSVLGSGLPPSGGWSSEAGWHQ